MFRTWPPVVINMTMTTRAINTRMNEYSTMPCPDCGTRKTLEWVGPTGELDVLLRVLIRLRIGRMLLYFL